MATKSGEYLIVAAIDFGTAFSGYAFSFRHTFKGDPIKVSTNSWSTGTGNLLSLKTTTCALFGPDKKFHSFGFEAEDKYSDLALDGNHREWYFFKHFKMNLYEKVHLNRNFKLEDTLGRTMAASIVFSNSIWFLKTHLLKTCRDRVPETHENDIRWVLTVPAIWGDAAKQFMREAALKSGIPGDHLLIALEPEAASLFCKYLPVEKFSGLDRRFKPFQPGSKYMVLDAGGGTVDITVHQVKQDGTLSEIFKASGGSWGGTYVDKAFTEFLTDIIGNDVMQTFIEEQTLDYIDLFRNFEVKKRGFQGQVTDKVIFKVPVSMNETFFAKRKKNIKDVLQSTKYANKVTWTGDKLRLTADVANSFFDDPCNKIVKHLEKIFLNPKVNMVDFILMVGGFSESPMLQDYIRRAFPNKRVIVPDEAGLVVLKGAVVFGHNTNVIAERKAKYTYGVGTAVAFIPGEHPEEKKFHNDDNVSLCDDIFSIHAQVGSTIRTGESQVAQHYSVTRKLQTAITFKVFASKKRNPRFTTDPGCIELGSLHLEIPGVGLGRSADVHLRFGETELHVHAVDQQTGNEVSAKFNFLSGDDHQDSNSDGNDNDSDGQSVTDFLSYLTDSSSSDSEFDDDYPFSFSETQHRLL